jgi:hypothetical protein
LRLKAQLQSLHDAPRVGGVRLGAKERVNPIAVRITAPRRVESASRLLAHSAFFLCLSFDFGQRTDSMPTIYRKQDHKMICISDEV